MVFRGKKAAVCALSAFLFGCSGFKSGGNADPATGRSVVAESAYCSSSSAVSSPVTITSTAQYKARTLSTSGLSAASSATTQPIRYAEVVILDSSSQTVQCGATDASGNLVATDLTSPLQIPKTAGTYTLKVNSRANNSKVAVSVLTNPYDNVPYSISSSFTLTGSESSKAVSLTAAPVTGSVEGGAFYILDQIYLANQFLRNNSACPTTEAGCTAFTVAPKIKVFWTAGLDPGTTYSLSSDPISAYVRSSDADFKGLYILGGKNGDSDCTDTDHFDPSVILHEYGHFLEEYFALANDSPGGSHTGNGLIDPRLAWSEGWADFFQAAVSGSPYYRDSIRNGDCTSVSPATKLQINLTLSEKVSGQDIPYNSGEGIFREVSVSRALYQAISAPSGSGKGASIGFNYVWRAFTSSSLGGLSSTSNYFRNAGMFNKFLYNLVNANDATKITAADPAGYDNVLTYEKQPHDLTGYATPISSGACAAYSITGGVTRDVDPSGTPLNSTTTPSLQKNARFYSYTWSGSGTFQVKLTYSKASSTASDLDLYVYKQTHSLFDKSTMIGYSEQVPASEVFEGGTSYSETVTASGVAAGTYLIQVNMDDGSPYNGVTANFTLTNGSGAALCP